MDREGLFQRRYRLRVFCLIEQSRAYVRIPAETFGRKLDDFLKHPGGVIVLRLAQIERPQQVVAAPVLGA